MDTRKEKIIEILKELEDFNPYPESVFIPISKKKLAKVVRLLFENGYSSDALYGHWGRQVWNNCVEKAKEMFESHTLDKEQPDFPETMDINAKLGYKVTVTEQTINNGYPHDKVQANKYLKVGEVYTVHHTDVGSWHTDVYLIEFPKISFNSVHFISVPQQPESKEQEKELPRDLNNPWPTKDVLAKLIWATEYLLHEKNYDGHNHEELNRCVNRGKEILKELSKEQVPERTAEDRKIIADLMAVVWWLGVQKEAGDGLSFKESLITDGSSTEPSKMTIKDVIDTIEHMIQDASQSGNLREELIKYEEWKCADSITQSVRISKEYTAIKIIDEYLNSRK